MEKSEAIEMMRRSSEEIKSLRRQIERLAPKADAYDAIRELQRLIPQPTQGFGEDVAWMLDRRIAQMQASPATHPVSRERQRGERRDAMTPAELTARGVRVKYIYAPDCDECGDTGWVYFSCGTPWRCKCQRKSRAALTTGENDD